MTRWLHRLTTAVMSIYSLLWSPGALAQGDPLEQMNKVVHDFNARVYNPSATTNRSMISRVIAGVPSSVKHSVFNFYSNMTEPVTALSSLLRGDWDNSGTAITRFLVNLTVGIGGIYDPATDMGIESRPTNLGHALCQYGVPDGPFLVIPFYGPSTVTDFLSAMIPPTAGYYAFGYAFAAYRAGQVLGDGGNAPENLAAVSAEIDYETLKRLYFERRHRLCPADSGTSVDSTAAATPLDGALPVQATPVNWQRRPDMATVQEPAPRF